MDEWHHMQNWRTAQELSMHMGERGGRSALRLSCTPVALLDCMRRSSHSVHAGVCRQSIIAEVENSQAAQYAAMPQEELHQWHANLQQSLSESSDAHHKAKDYLKQVGVPGVGGCLGVGSSTGGPAWRGWCFELGG